jgi:hypothetical protein
MFLGVRTYNTVADCTKSTSTRGRQHGRRRECVVIAKDASTMSQASAPNNFCTARCLYFLTRGWHEYGYSSILIGVQVATGRAHLCSVRPFPTNSMSMPIAQRRSDARKAAGTAMFWRGFAGRVDNDRDQNMLSPDES